MNKFYCSICLIAACLLGFAAHANAAVRAVDFEVSSAWVRATAPGQEAAGIDMTITCKQASVLIGVTSSAASSAELHSMSSENGMMKMREVKTIELPAGQPFNLRAHGYHLMLNGLKSSLKEGESVPLTLNIKTGKRLVKVEARAEVKSQHATNNMAAGNEHHHDH